MEPLLRLSQDNCESYNCEKVNLIQRRFEFLIEESSDVFEIISPEGKILYISPAVERIIGYKPEERIGRSCYELYDEKEKQRVIRLIKLALSNPDKRFKEDIAITTRSGKKIYLEITMRNFLSEPSINGIAVNFRDITERIENQKKIIHSATHDLLTKLPNRLQFMKEISKECEIAQNTKRSFALMRMDIDGLKEVNNVLGYHHGDELIIRIGQRIQNLLGEKGSLYRSSGDKFSILVRDLSTTEEYEKLANDIMDLFTQPFKLDKYELYVTVSMGVSICVEGCLDPDTMMRQADMSLRKAKNEGKNRCAFFSSTLELASYREFTLRNDLLNAIEKNQLRIFYQPLIRLRDNEIIGAEALVRWEHHDLGMISPGEFIPMAEETGYIINIGKWMLKEVCRNYKKWLESGLPNIKVSINYSIPQFLEKDFVKSVKETIDEFGLDPSFLIMEITESIFMTDFKQTKAKINELQEWGIEVALDDFGTGYSSLSYLSELDINMIKIDRSFISNISLNNTSTIITRMLIDTSQELKLKLVAEGIETNEQLHVLRNFNCDTGQGFLYSRPIPEQDFTKILKMRKCEPLHKAKE